MKKDMPVGKLTFHHVKDSQAKDMALYVDLFYTDENNDMWTFPAATFLYEFKKIDDKLPFDSESNLA